MDLCGQLNDFASCEKKRNDNIAQHKQCSWPRINRTFMRGHYFILLLKGTQHCDRFPEQNVFAPVGHQRIVQ